jgi:hypothetical protein
MVQPTFSIRYANIVFLIIQDYYLGIVQPFSRFNIYFSQNTHTIYHPSANMPDFDFFRHRQSDQNSSSSLFSY